MGRWAKGSPGSLRPAKPPPCGPARPSCGAESAPSFGGSSPRLPSSSAQAQAQAPPPGRGGASGLAPERLCKGLVPVSGVRAGRGMPARSGAQVSAHPGERAPHSTHGRGSVSEGENPTWSRTTRGKPVTCARRAPTGSAVPRRAPTGGVGLLAGLPLSEVKSRPARGRQGGLGT